MSGAGLWLAVAALSGLGAVLRFLVDTSVTRRLGGRLPAGTALVNASGCLVLGVLTGMAVGHGAALLLGAALVGSYTTFSTWVLETLVLVEGGRGPAALANVAGQVLAGLAASGAGWAVGAAM